LDWGNILGEEPKKAGVNDTHVDMRALTGDLTQYRQPNTAAGLRLRPLTLGHKDFSVAVRDCAPSPRPWRWEIYRAGRKSAIQCSRTFFETAIEAERAGSAALASLLSEHPD
jgi:hypothetical protein